MIEETGREETGKNANRASDELEGCEKKKDSTRRTTIGEETASEYTRGGDVFVDFCTT